MNRIGRTFDLRRALLIGSTVAMTLAGCGESTKTSYDIPAGAFQYISQAELDMLAKLGIKINEGLTPPNTVGTYYCNSMMRAGGNIPDDSLTKFANMSLEFLGQNSDDTLMVSYVQNTESGSGLGSFVSGKGNDFTVYTQINGLYGHVPFTDAMLFSGTVAADGVHHLMQGLMLTHKGDDPSKMLIEVDQARVMAESDALATRTSSFP